MDQLSATISWEIVHADIEALGVPVLFIVGSHDQIFPPAPLADSCARIAGSRFAEIPASGHSPYFEQPAAGNEVEGVRILKADSHAALAGTCG